MVFYILFYGGGVVVNLSHLAWILAVTRVAAILVLLKSVDAHLLLMATVVTICTVSRRADLGCWKITLRLRILLVF